MKTLPMQLGWTWLKDSFALYRKRSLALSGLSVLYLSITIIISKIPFIGNVLSFTLNPLLFMGLMYAYFNTQHNRPVSPDILFKAFKERSSIRLCQLGLIYFVCFALIIVCSSYIIDDGFLLKIMLNKTTFIDAIDPPKTLWATALASILYLPFMMTLGLAIPLIVWQEMSVFKAMFYSFFAVLRATKPYLTYGLILFGITLLGFILLTCIFWLFILLITPNELAFSITVILASLLFSLALTTVVYCSFYVIYASIFGSPKAPEVDA